jgi:dolichol-phosphate mannosyltransferase
MDGGFCVVIPMYNEEFGAEECIRRVCSVLATIPFRNKLVVVNDGSQDRTGDILARMAHEFEVLMVVEHAKNSGYGSALRTGASSAEAAGFDYVLFMDSDLTNDPQDLPKFVNKMRQGYDVIKGTRYSGGGKVIGVPFLRVAISAVGNRIARALLRLPLHDCTNGFRAIKTPLLMHMCLKENRFPIIMEELYWSKFLAGRFAEVPVTLTNRDEELRQTSFVYRPRIFYDYLKYPALAFLGVKPSAVSRIDRARR